MSETAVSSGAWTATNRSVPSRWSVRPTGLWLVFPLLAVLAASGCARAPAGTSVGPRLAVTLVFLNQRMGGPVLNANYYYYFLIRNAADDKDQNGPVAVLGPPYGNGFAADQHAGTGTPAFTDFVLYTNAQPSSTGYLLYHLVGGINGNANAGPYEAEPGKPEVTTAPDVNNPGTLYFELPLKDLTPPNGETDPNKGQLPRYLQVNAIVTTKLSHDPQSVDPNKFTDAFGDQRNGSGSQNFVLQIDTSQVGRVWQSSPNEGDPFYEPDNDTYPSASDPSIEMIAWKIQVLD